MQEMRSLFHFTRLTLFCNSDWLLGQEWNLQWLSILQWSCTWKKEREGRKELVVGEEEEEQTEGGEGEVEGKDNKNKEEDEEEEEEEDEGENKESWLSDSAQLMSLSTRGDTMS